MTNLVTRSLATTIALGLLTLSSNAIAHKHGHMDGMPGKMDHSKMKHPMGHHKGKAKTKMPHKSSHHGKGHHHHKKIAVPAGQPIPEVMLKVTPDSMTGWNMQIMLKNFSFTPEKVNQESDTTNGHAHLMLNGRKLARLYGTWYHIPRLPEGKNTLSVVLNTNKHEELTHNGKSIEASVAIAVPPKTAVTSPAPAANASTKKKTSQIIQAMW